jgi:uncharacterized membrane protein YkoI
MIAFRRTRSPLLALAICLTTASALESALAEPDEMRSPGSSMSEQQRKISDDEAKAIAVAAVPGDAVGVQIEKKLGKQSIVVEVISAQDSGEVDVIIDMVTGEVRGIED